MQSEKMFSDQIISQDYPETLCRNCRLSSLKNYRPLLEIYVDYQEQMIGYKEIKLDNGEGNHAKFVMALFQTPVTATYPSINQRGPSPLRALFYKKHVLND